MTDKNNCWLIFNHDWSKWSEIEQESWAMYSKITGIKVEGSSRTKEYQERKCTKCNKQQKRYLT